MNNNKNRKQKNVPDFPPSYIAQPVMFRKIRYQASSQLTGVAVTQGCLAVSMMARSATASSTEAISLLSSFKIKRITIWALNNSSAVTSTSFSTCSITWAGSQSPNKEISAVGVNTKPAKISTKPPPGSLASFWYYNDGSAANNVLFFLTVPGGTIIDLDLDYVLQDGANADAVVLAAASTSQFINYACLDCLNTTNTTGGNLLVPVSLTTVNLANK